jgi:hypothetical protein
VSFGLGAGALAAGTALALAGHTCLARERRRRLSGRRPQPRAALRARWALHAGLAVLGVALLALFACR